MGLHPATYAIISAVMTKLIKNYTTDIPVEKTISEIQKILAQNGARGIMLEYDGNGNIASLNFTSFNGDLLALAGAGVFALFSVLGKKYQYDQVVSVFIYFLTALVLITPTLFLFSSLRIPSVHIWFWLLLNGFLVNGISYIFWFKALEHGDTHIISNALYLTPFLSLVYIWLLLGEKILLTSVLGLVVIVVGIILQSVKIAHLRNASHKTKRLLKGGEAA